MNQLEFYKLLELLGLRSLDFYNKDDRQLIQYVVYLLFEGGIYCGYGFRWSVNRPFSDELSANLQEWREDEPSTQELTMVAFKDYYGTKEFIQDFTDTFEPFYDDLERMELFAKWNYINELCFHGEGRFESIEDYLLTHQPYYKRKKNINIILRHVHELLEQYKIDTEIYG